MKPNTNRKTVGAISQELATKEAPTRSPIELGNEMLRDYEDYVMEAVEKGKKELSKDFYLVVLFGRPRLYRQVITRKAIIRHSCPTPHYDQTVYKYIRADDKLQFLWAVPDKKVCELYRSNASSVDPSEWQLLKMVMDYNDGTLLDMAKKLNGELK